MFKNETLESIIMTIKKLVEQMVTESFKDDESKEISLKLIRANGKNEIKSILDDFCVEDGE